MIDCSRVAQALTVFDPDAWEASVVKAGEQRAAFMARFPKEGWPSMTLQRYALGQRDAPDSFCRWLEFVTTELGSIRGGSARKHLIYHQAAANEWWFDRGAYADVDEAWRAVHDGFMEAIAAAERGDWDAIERIPSLRSGPAVVNKTLSIYFPDELLPINSQTHLRYFLRELGDRRADDPAIGTTRLNRMLLEGLRTCPELDGWTTKQMERLLYESDLDPFMAARPGGPIANVADFIARRLEEIDSSRLEARRQAEDQARKLLSEYAGRMTEEQARSLLKLFNADYYDGKPHNARFSPAFVGQTANGLVADLDAFNSWTARVWNGTAEEAWTAVGEMLADRKALPSAGTSYPTMLMYLREPEKSAIWLRILDRGLQRLTTYEPAKAPANGGLDDYADFCRAAERLLAEYDIPPEALDYVLAAAGRAADSPPAAPTPAGERRVWIFQANPSAYDIDHALSEAAELSWAVRQHTNEVHVGDRVYIWRSGGDAGVIAVATVASEPEAMQGDTSDPYVLKPEALSTTAPHVRLRIDRVLPTAMRRSDLLQHSVLKDLQVIRFPNATNFPVTPDEDAALQAMIGDLHVPPLREEIEERVHLPRPWLEEAVSLMREKGQIIFYGPPGTGKTFVALAIAGEITREGGDTRVVQFHPSYSYEDFVGGFRPVEAEGDHGVTYRRVDGPLRRMAAAAAADPQHPYVLIVDEINRGNIPKIFGELLFLLEYRHEAVRLQYWPEEEFSLPDNLFVIGTMNTADRSIALVDSALRRRFYFVPFVPTAPPVKDVLGRWLAAHGHDDEAARMLDALNDTIAKDDLAIGPSYFMTDVENGPNLERIWDRAIMPLLEEYYYGTEWQRERFSLNELRARLGPGAGDDDEARQSSSS